MQTDRQTDTIRDLRGLDGQWYEGVHGEECWTDDGRQMDGQTENGRMDPH